MWRQPALAAAVLALGLTVGSAARAADTQAWTWCKGGGAVTADQQISGCTAIVGAPGQPPAAQALAFYQRGLAHRARGDLAGAVADFNQATKLVPNFFQAYFARANAYHDLGDRGRAIDDYSRVIALKPQAAVAYNNRCWTRAESGTMLEAALADCDQAVRLLPSSAAMLSSRAYVDFRLGRFDQAIADADAALKFDVDADAVRAGALYVRGVAEVRTGDLGGQLDLADAQAADPDIGAKYAALGVAP